MMLPAAAQIAAFSERALATTRRSRSARKASLYPFSTPAPARWLLGTSFLVTALRPSEASPTPRPRIAVARVR